MKNLIFENIVGNEKNKNLLKEIISSRNISHSYMFLGKSGIGKFLFAKEFAKGILCKNLNGPCNECKSCIEFDTSNNPDLFIIDTDENSIKVDQIRLMINKIIEKPIISERKVYIINDADKMTTEAANCLLKTLEEPPEYITIILIGESENMFLTTVRSRCTKVYFEEISKKDLESYFKLNCKNTEIPEKILEAAQGSILKVQELLQNKDIYIIVDNIFENIENANIIDVLNKKDLIFKNKEIVFNVLEYIINIFFSKIASNSSNNIKYINAINYVQEAIDKLKKNNNYDMTIDNLLFKICEEF